MLGAISTRGLLATMTMEAATDRDIFLTYLDQVPCPKLRPGDVAVMDNLSVHKVKGVRESIEAGEPGCSTCPLTRPTWTPSKKLGASSSNGCARPKHGPKKRSANCSGVTSLWACACKILGQKSSE